MASKVYFTDLHVHHHSLLEKFDRLITAAGIDNIDFAGKYVAVKIHFGEVGNMAFLRHQYAKVLCDHVKKQGGKPFLTDCNTLYVGYRNNALDHLDAAYMNGYNPLSTGVHTIIADGLKGAEDRLIPVAGGEYVKEAKIGAAIADADVIISLTHFKGHLGAGFGGTLKNIGMGSGSRRGKMEMHSAGIPFVKQDLCVGCGMCVKNCANDGVHITDGKAAIDDKKCLGCGYCIAFCAKNAITPRFDEARPVMNRKIAEYTKAVVDGKPAFHISMVMNVSPNCDCAGRNDIPVVPDVGMFASFDPIALDQACVDAVNAQPVIPGSCADGLPDPAEGHDVFRAIHPDTNWEAGLIHGEKLGLGTREYEIVKLK